MTTLSHIRRAKPDTLPADAEQARLVFLARHLHDLQSIRFAGLAIAFLEMLLFGHVALRAQPVIMAVTVAFAVAWYFFSSGWYRARYGRIRSKAITFQEKSAGWHDPLLAIAIATFIALLWGEILWTNPHHMLIFAAPAYILYISWPVRILKDRTNLPQRQWANILVFTAWCAAMTVPNILLIPAMLHGWFGSTRLRQFQFDLLAAFGAIMLASWLYDAWLLQRTFHKTQTQGVG